MICSPARRALTSSLMLGLALGLLVTAALVPSDTHASGRGVREGGVLTIGVRQLDYVDPALTLPFVGGTTASLVSRGLADATCALLLRYPVSTPPVVRYDLVPEVATKYPEVSPDGRTYTFTIRKGYRFSTGARVTAQNY